MWGFIALVAVIAAMAISISLAYGGSYHGSEYGGFGPYWMMGSGFYGIGFLMPVVGAVAVVIFLLVLYFAFFTTGNHNVASTAANNVSPEDMVRGKYARGEISEDEYRRVMENLRR